MEIDLSSDDRGFRMRCKLTVAIPTRNSMLTLPRVVQALYYQNVPFKLLFADNSTDGTGAYLRAPEVKQYWRDRDPTTVRSWCVLPDPEVAGDKQARIAQKRAYLAASVDTDYVFSLDSDIILPPGALRGLVEEFEQEEGLGGLAVPFGLSAGHVHDGALLMRTDVANQIDSDVLEDECCCKCVSRYMDEHKMTLRYWSRGDSARHLRYEH
jgi:glycosyltransferase involved in cell wall biosynthesis